MKIYRAVCVCVCVLKG